MFYVGIGGLVIGLTQGYIQIEEELLIILGSIVWLDAGGKLIKEGIAEQIEGKSREIKEKYEWFLNKKRDIVAGGVRVYKQKVEVGAISREIENYIIRLLISINIGFFLYNFLFLEKYSRILEIINRCILVSQRNFMFERNARGELVNQKNIYLNKYTSPSLIENIIMRFTQEKVVI